MIGIQDNKGGNFRSKDGHLYLVRCFSCDKNGRENWSQAVASGVCAWCGWKEEHAEEMKL